MFLIIFYKLKKVVLWYILNYGMDGGWALL